MRYSLRWSCPIKMVYLLDGQMKSGNVTITSLFEEELMFITARNKKTPVHLPFSDILAAGYARGDDGDTSKREQKTPKENHDR